MANPRHKNGTKTFPELSFSEGAKSINAAVASLGKAIERNIGKSTAPLITRGKRRAQIGRLLSRI